MSYQPTQRMVVSAYNASGEPDFYFCIITDIPEDEYDDGEHYAVVRQIAEREGYESVNVVYDEVDIIRTGLVGLFVWESASTFSFSEI